MDSTSQNRIYIAVVTKQEVGRDGSMAAWQFNITIVRRDKIKKREYVVNSEEFDDVIEWDGYIINKGSLSAIATILEPTVSWRHGTRQYGRDESTVLRLHYEAGGLSEIAARIDVSNMTQVLLVALIEFMTINNAMMLIEGVVYETTIENLIKQIKRSTAYQFCKNPMEFIEKLAEENSSIKH